nr:extracellular solute-binding protein [Marinitoga lauensis]
MHAWADGLAISANTKHPKEAWEFIKFLINERKAAEYYPGKVPFYKGEANSYEWNEYASAGKLPVHKPIILDYGENAKHFFTKYWKFWRGYASAEGSGLSALIDDLLNEKIDLNTFYERADKEINRMLKKAYRK